MDPDAAMPTDGGATSAEVCGNGSDDDGDGVADCADRDCALEPGCPPLCEAPEGARCFYIDAVAGDDANDGSFGRPWRTYLNVVSYYGSPGPDSDGRPAGHVLLGAGDVVYLMSGTYGATYRYNGRVRAFHVRAVHGEETRPVRLTAYPGESPVLEPEQRAVGIYIQQSRHWQVDGIEVRGAYGSGVWVAESDDVALRALHVHDTDGVDNNNIAGIQLLSSTRVVLADSIVHDNYDRTAEDTGGRPTENSMNVVAFRGGFIQIVDNHIYNTPAVSGGMHGGCIKYKHMRDVDGGTFLVARNRLESCAFMSVGTGSPDSTIAGNLIIDSAPIVLKDFGGPTLLRNIRVAYNTMVGGAALRVSPSQSGAPAADLRFDHNVVVDDASSYGQENGIVSVGTYETDAAHDDVLARDVLAFDDDCYHNASADPRFGFFAASGSYGSSGGVYALSEWQALGYDLGSSVVDPMLDSDFVPGAAACDGRGHAHASAVLDDL